MKNFAPLACLIAAVISSQLHGIQSAATVKLASAVSQNRNSSISEEIHVEAFVRDKRILQLNITLFQEIGSNYDIAITSVPTNRSSDHCVHLQNCVVHGISGTQRSVTFPINADYLTDHEYCQFQNDCYYNITASAVSKKTTNVISTVYHIKECVNGLCLCKNTEKLPTPLIYPKLLGPRQLYFQWEIVENHNNNTQSHGYSLQYLRIDIEEMRECNISWSGTKSIASFSENLDNFGLPIRKNDFTKELPNNTEARCVQIRMSVFDSRLCKGPEVSVIVHLSAILPPRVVHYDITFQLILICLVAVFTTAAVIVVVYVFFWKTRKKNVVNYWRGVYHNVQNGGTVMTNNPLYFDKEDEDWFEIPPSSIKEIGREIGKGAFGRVYVGRISDIPGKLNSQVVAIKKLKKSPTPDQLEEFVGEIATMKKVGKHPNVVRLLGFCTVEQPLMMIMEFVPCGDLLKYLRKVRAKHEEKLARTNKVEQNANVNCISSGSIKHSSSNHSQIQGPHGKYSDILHPYSTSSASESSSYVSQPVSIPSTAQMNGSGPTISRPSFAETLYTNFTNSSNPELTGMINSSLEYVVDHTELHNFAVQIARGMNHLQKLQITHRDLAARNVLIDENKTLKISDFGLSRSGIYVNTKNKKVPLRWLSLEAMKDNLYSSKSDVWAFAILLWEIGTLGGFPYPTVCNLDLLNYLKSGQRLERPENCSESLYELMLQCWAADPEDRPDFSDICRKLDPNKNKIYIDFNELSPNYVFPPTSEEISARNVAEKLSKI